MERILPVIEGLRTETDAPISVDTRSPAVAARALELGADIVNDVAGCRDSEWPAVLAEWDCPVVLAHMQGTPADMQRNPGYPCGVTTEVLRFFAERLRWLEEQGMDPGRAILDPGIGFGKRVKDNWELIRNIEAFRVFRRPIFLGTSRKSFLREFLGQDKEKLDEGTLLVNTMAFLKGADMLRVHDVPLAAMLKRVFLAMHDWPDKGEVKR
jgi:dihydropteroate synthase